MDLARWYNTCMQHANDIKGIWAELRALHYRVKDLEADVYEDGRPPARSRKAAEAQADLGSR
jgi:hypothetical protein